MTSAYKWLCGIPLTIAAPAMAQATEACGVIGRIVAASGEATPFQSIREALARGESVVPGFPAEHCRVGESRVFWCELWTRPGTAFDDWPDPLACAGLAPAPAPRRRMIGGDWVRAYRAGDLLITYGLDCTICAGPASIRLTARFDPADEGAR